MPTNHIISIAGMPGAGKSTLAKSLSEMFGIKLLIGGDVARAQAKIDPEIAAALAAGQFAPKEKMNAAMKVAISQALEGGEDLIVEGYPRYREQLDDLIEVGGNRVVFIWLGCNDSVATQRMLNRKRDDDKASIISFRLLGFWADTYPLLADGKMKNLAHLPIGSKLDVLNGAVNFLTSIGAITWNQNELPQDKPQESTSSTNQVTDSTQPSKGT